MPEKPEATPDSIEAFQAAMAPVIGLYMKAIAAIEIAGTVQNAEMLGLFDDMSDPQFEFALGAIPTVYGGAAEGSESMEIWRGMMEKSRQDPEFHKAIGRLRLRIAQAQNGMPTRLSRQELNQLPPGPSRLHAMLDEMHDMRDCLE